MFKARRRIFLGVVYCLIALIFIALAVFLVPQTKINDFVDYTNTFPTTVTAVLFCILLLTASSIYGMIRLHLEHTIMRSGATAFLTEFTDRLRQCYSREDFYNLISEILEIKADCSVLYVDRKNNYVLYNSPARFTSNQELMDKMERYYPVDWKEGVFFLGENLGVVSKSKNARGFFISSGGYHFFVFCRYTRRFDLEIYPRLQEEIERFQRRAQTISDLSEISELSKEWEQLAETQRSFLPQSMPEPKGLKLAAYFRPLINVSGDYYTVLPIDENKNKINSAPTDYKSRYDRKQMTISDDKLSTINQKTALQYLDETYKAWIEVAKDDQEFKNRIKEDYKTEKIRIKAYYSGNKEDKK